MIRTNGTGSSLFRCKPLSTTMVRDSEESSPGFVSVLCQNERDPVFNLLRVRLLGQRSAGKNVTEFPETRNTLLVQVRSPANREAWEEFALIYQPVICRSRHTNIADREGTDFYLTLETGRPCPALKHFWPTTRSQSSSLVRTSTRCRPENFATKAGYLPDPKFQELAPSSAELW